MHSKLVWAELTASMCRSCLERALHIFSSLHRMFSLLTFDRHGMPWILFAFAHCHWTSLWAFVRWRLAITPFHWRNWRNSMLINLLMSNRRAVELSQRMYFCVKILSKLLNTSLPVKCFQISPLKCEEPLKFYDDAKCTIQWPYPILCAPHNRISFTSCSCPQSGSTLTKPQWCRN